MAFYIDNAISWAQFRVRGGWKNLLMVCLGYTFVAVFCITLFYQLAELPRDKQLVLSTSATMIMAVQVVLELLLCSMMIANSIRRDITNRQMESHRLMPLSATQGVAGYVAGGSIHILTLAFVNLLMGCAISHSNGVSVNDWLAANLLLLLFSMTIWCVIAMGAFLSRAMFAFVLLICGGIIFSGGFILIILPGLLAFCTPMHARTIFQTSSIWRLDGGALVGIVSQFLLSILFIRGAARKYADASAQALTIGSALALLGIWAGLSWFGIADFAQIRPEHLTRVDMDWHALIVGALASCLLFALLPVATIAWSDIRRQQHRRAGELSPSREWVFWAVLPICVLFACAPLSSRLNPRVVFFQHYYSYGAYKPTHDPALLLSNLPVLSYSKHSSPLMIAAACAIFLIQAYYLMRLLYPVLRRANLLIALIILLAWWVPLIADLIYYGLLPGNVQPRMDQFAVFSPVGTMIQAIDNPVRSAWPGVVFQGCIAVIVMALFLFVRTRRRIIDSRRGFPLEAVSERPSAAVPES